MSMSARSRGRPGPRSIPKRRGPIASARCRNSKKSHNSAATIRAGREGDEGVPMAMSSGSYDVVILGSGIAGLAGALAAHELGLQPVVLEKAALLGGGTVHSYGLVWFGQNHL